MPRPERALDPRADPVQRFACDLRELRRDAGTPTYRELAKQAHYSATVLAEAASGRRLPTLAATLAYVRACGGEPAAWERRWRDLASRAVPSGGHPARLAELPPASDGFVGRRGELAWLSARLRPAGTPPLAPPIVVIHGIGGVGKSALALTVGHRLAAEFPDGQLFAGLHGYVDGLAPLDPAEVLGRFLRSLGLVDREIPATVEEATARYRSRLAGRRVLVMLDNVRDSAQVRPLLPGAPTCAVLVTGRAPLLDLDGASHLRLDHLHHDEATALLGRLAGPSRIAAEPEAAAALARACDHLPLALRIAGGRLAARPGLSVQALADRLARVHRRLDELQLGDLAVRASLQLSYRNLGPDGPVDLSRAYRLLSLLDGPDFGTPVAAAQLGCGEPAAAAVLDRLASEHLIEEDRPGRYRFHDLPRLFARELASTTEPVRARRAALRRVLRCYQALAARATRLLAPDQRSDQPVDARVRDQALASLEAERPGIVAAVRVAASCPASTAALVPPLVLELYEYFQARPHWLDWERLNLTALSVARRLGDLPAQAQLLRGLGVAYRKLFRMEAAVTALTEGLRIHERIGDRRNAARVLNQLGVVYYDLSRNDEAIGCLEESLARLRQVGDRTEEASTLNNLAAVLQRVGRIDEALARCRQSLAVWRELGDRRRAAVVSSNLADALVRAGQLEQATDCYRQALGIAREFGDQHGESYTLVGLGEAQLRAGRWDAARALFEQGLAIDRKLGHRWGEGRALHLLGQLCHELGDAHRARQHWQGALRCFEEIGAPEQREVLERLRSGAGKQAASPGRSQSPG
jgi:tetratricopeptide (TPR) repeat protein